jgi:SYF2 splicing factor
LPRLCCRAPCQHRQYTCICAHSQEARAKFSRRRTEYEAEDIDYINDRNKHFNKKIKRAYDKYTVETRQNLERGTAL